MIARSISEVRRNIRLYIDMVIDEEETMFITRGNNKNAVVISEKTFDYYTKLAKKEGDTKCK
jgi:PHD/YefM family antitoxin component YafN of YafNO toxin-antitoxin module